MMLKEKDILIPLNLVMQSCIPPSHPLNPLEVLHFSFSPNFLSLQVMCELFVDVM